MNFTSYLLAVGCVLCAPAGNVSAAPRPNIVMVFIDDMGWDDLPCFANKDAQTPNIDRIAADAGEGTNLVATHPEVVARLTKATLAWHQTLPQDKGPALGVEGTAPTSAPRNSRPKTTK